MGRSGTSLKVKIVCLHEIQFTHSVHIGSKSQALSIIAEIKAIHIPVECSGQRAQFAGGNIIVLQDAKFTTSIGR
jgi:hypothetical protein